MFEIIPEMMNLPHFPLLPYLDISAKTLSENTTSEQEMKEKKLVSDENTESHPTFIL